MDGPGHLGADKRAVGADPGGLAARRGQHLAGAQHATLDHLAEGHARLGALRSGDFQRRTVIGAHPRHPRGGNLAIGLFPFDADEAAAQHLGDGPGGAGAEERVQHDIAGMGGGNKDAVQQGLGLLRGMGLVAVFILDALAPGAERDHPVRPHLHSIVQFLQRFVVEGVFAGFVAAGPDQGFMGVGQALAAKVRHRVGLAPDHVVQDPEPLILQGRADAEDVVIAADHPERAVRLEQAAGGGQPIAGKAVVGGEAGKLVPVVVHGIDHGIVGAVQLALELQVVGRICEDQVDRPRRQAVHHLDAVAAKDLVQRKHGCLRRFGLRHLLPLPLRLDAVLLKAG